MRDRSNPSSQWEEPFGMVLTETMACGAPVVALARGGAPELIVDGVTGFLGAREEDLAGAIAPHAGAPALVGYWRRAPVLAAPSARAGVAGGLPG